MSDVHLEDLFHECDRHGEGRIGPDEFRELCAKFEIGPGDADVIFADLDRDGDGQICLEDFALGFRDFLSTPAKPDRSSASLDAGGTDRRNSNAWAHFVASIGEPALQKLFHTRWVRDIHNDCTTFYPPPPPPPFARNALLSLRICYLLSTQSYI